MMPTLIFLIIMLTIINIIMVNSFVTWIYDEFDDDTNSQVARAFLRLCLVPPIGIVVAAVCLISIIVGWIIIMILEIWDR